MSSSSQDQDGGRSPKRRRTSTNEGASSSRAADDCSMEEKGAKPVAVVAPVKREPPAEARREERGVQIRRLEARLEEMVQDLLYGRMREVLRSMPVSEVLEMMEDDASRGSGRQGRTSSSSIEVLPDGPDDTAMLSIESLWTCSEYVAILFFRDA